MANQKIRIRLKGYDHEIVDQSTSSSSTPPRRPVPRFPGPVHSAHRAQPVLGRQGPHVDKDSREQFEMRTHKRLIDILEPTPNTVDSLMRLDLPAGVDIEIKL